MIKLFKKDTYRSQAKVNMTEDMVRVTLDMPVVTWYLFKKTLKESGFFSLKLDDNESD